jgi:predicted hotdog family 3-hydroxylacyl-ACP dehydratase
MSGLPEPGSLVPHGGEMCLLSRIVSATDREIVCAATSHRSITNPLRRDGRLAALHLAEYGAQAMAVHGGLSDPAAKDRGGMLVAIRDLTLQVERLDDVDGELTVSATRLVANAEGQIYAFSASAGGRELGRGRVSVIWGQSPAADRYSPRSSAALPR